MSVLKHIIQELVKTGIEQVLSERELRHLQSEYGEALAVAVVQMHRGRFRLLLHQEAHLVIFRDGATLMYRRGPIKSLGQRVSLSCRFSDGAFTKWPRFAGKHVCMNAHGTKYLLTPIKIRPRGLDLHSLCHVGEPFPSA